MTIYRNANDMAELAQQALEKANTKNEIDLKIKKDRASKFLPKILSHALSQIKKVSERGEYWIDYEPLIWSFRCWYYWDSILCSFLKEELEKKNFKCVILPYSKPALRINWNK